MSLVRSRRLAVGIAGFLVLTGAGAAPAQAGIWGSDQAIPSSSGAVANSSRNVGLADDGSAVVVWNDNTNTYAATREAVGGTWTKTTLSNDGGVTPPMVSMNGAGDIAIAWDRGTGINVGYKPDGGAWQQATLDTGSAPRAPSVAINSAGDAVVVWLGGTGGDFKVRSAARTKAGAWPAAATFDEVSDYAEIPVAEPGSGTVGVFSCNNETAAAIDDTGKALALWADVYTSFFNVPEDDQYQVCGVRMATRSSGSWGAVTALTARPSDGTYSQTSGEGGDQPATGAPRADFDPVSGKVVAAFAYAGDGIAGPPPDFTANFDSVGSVIAQGTIGSTLTPGAPIDGGDSTSDRPSAGANGGFQTAAIHHAGSSTDVIRGGTSPAGTAIPLTTLTTVGDDFSQSPLSVFTDAGGDGTGFFVYNQFVPPSSPTSSTVQAWTLPSGSATATGPTQLFANPTGSIRGVGVSANCRGDAIAVAGFAGAIHYADYASGNSACGEPPPPPPPPGGGGGSTVTPIITPAPPPAEAPKKKKAKKKKKKGKKRKRK